MRKLLLIAVIAIILAAPLSLLPAPTVGAVSNLAPFTPHETKVLVVSPDDAYYSGANYLTADLARYGFNITYQASSNALYTNYVTDPKTSDLNQYDVVIVHGILGFPTSRVSAQEVAHFINYRGTLILIGNPLMQNESNTWWGFDSGPIRTIEQRLGVDIVGFMGAGGAWHNTGTFTLKNTSIAGLPNTLQYIAPFTYSGSIAYQLDLNTNGASTIYDFTITSSPSMPLVGKTAPGVTYYKNASGAVGIYIQGAYIFGSQSGTNRISYFGFEDISKRPPLLASLIAFVLQKDINTIIKPQPLASVRLDSVGLYYSPTYLSASLSNFNSAIDAYNLTPTIAFTDFLDSPTFTSPIDYWKNVAPTVLSQLKSLYHDWEYSSSLRYYTDVRPMTQAQVETLINNIRGNYTRLGIEPFSTAITPNKGWNQTTLDAMASKNLYLLDIPANETIDWSNIRVNSSVIVHSSLRLLEFFSGENFTQPSLDKDTLNQKYFSRRHTIALAVVNGFPSFVYFVPNFRWNQVGPYSLQTIFSNLTADIPDIRFVPLMEAGLYFGNRWMRIGNTVKDGLTIEFDVDTSAIPTVANIEKGMIWLRINANESIQAVTIDGKPWFYFDTNSVRMPVSTSANSMHVKITLGNQPSPQVAESRYKVVNAIYDGYRFNVSVVATPGLNVSVRLFLPQVGTFRTGNWSVFSFESEWNYQFDSVRRLFDSWAVSDGYVSFEVGIFWIIERTPPWYNSTVTLRVNFTGVPTSIQGVTLGYNVNDEWTNITMTPQDGLWVATIPQMPYATSVQYKMLLTDNMGRLFTTGILNYVVTDETPPEIGDPTWNPTNPNADQPVTVQVSVTETVNSSGVGGVFLWYAIGEDISQVSQAKSINMTRNGNSWSAVIPGQSGGSPVSFFIIAYDKAGNTVQTSRYNFKVASFPITLVVILLIGAGTACAIAAVVYFVKVRRPKAENKNATNKTVQDANQK